MRPVLLPGTHVLTRSRGELQIGLDPRTALVLRDDDRVRSVVRMLADSARQEEHDHPAVLDLLARHGLLVDHSALMPLLAGPPDESDRDRHRVAALARADGLAGTAGADLASADRTRRRGRIEVRSFGHAAGEGLPGRLEGLLRAGAVGTRPEPGSGVDLGVLVGVGEPDRELVDAWTREGTPHLLVRMVEGSALVGPFVVPGRTACLRCLDAHCTDSDAAWPLLVRQYAAASRGDRADGTPEPLDPLLAALATAWAARDVATYLEGGRPATWSATVAIDGQLRELETRSWWRHPGCGCSWT